MSITRDGVLGFVKSKGPCLPNDIKKELGSDTMIIGAVLSELVASKLVRISTMKVGGSPLYYAPGTEFRLQEHSKHLNEKDRQAYELLKSKRVLRDKQLTPLIRVSLRTIKDFAKPVEVNSVELFWKWYLLPDEMANEEIQKAIGQPKTEIVSAEPKVQAQDTRLETQKHLAEKQPQASFVDEVQAYFSKNKIEIQETAVIKKNSEIDYIIKIPSPVGNLRYFCKAKAKKLVNQGDLSTAYVQGESKKLPVLFLSKGELNKKAKSMLEREFQNMKLQKI